MTVLATVDESTYEPWRRVWGSERDLRAVELGLRARSMGDVAEDFRAGLQPFVERCGLTMPEPEAIGVPPFDADERPGAEA